MRVIAMTLLPHHAGVAAVHTCAHVFVCGWFCGSRYRDERSVSLTHTQTLWAPYRLSEQSYCV